MHSFLNKIHECLFKYILVHFGARTYLISIIYYEFLLLFCIDYGTIWVLILQSGKITMSFGQSPAFGYDRFGSLVLIIVVLGNPGSSEFQIKSESNYELCCISYMWPRFITQYFRFEYGICPIVFIHQYQFNPNVCPIFTTHW